VNSMDTSELEESRMGKEYQNVFQVIATAKTCSDCSLTGATIECMESTCNKSFHLQCAMQTGWNFTKRGSKKFLCETHRHRKTETPKPEGGANTANVGGSGLLNHNLLARFGAVPRDHSNVPSNLDMGGTAAPTATDNEKDPSSGSESEDTTWESDEENKNDVLDVPLASASVGAPLLVRLERASIKEPWRLSLQLEAAASGSNSVKVASADTSQSDLFSLRVGDVINSINGNKIGTSGLSTLRQVLSSMKDRNEMVMEVFRS